MKTLSVTCTCVLMLGASLLTAQSSADSSMPAPSLAELARQIREQKPASAPRAKRLYDNSNLPKDPNGAWRANSRDGQTEDTAAAKKDDKDAKGKDDKDKKDKKDDSKGVKDSKASGEDEQVWRARFAKLREALGTEARRLDVMQRELNLAQIQSYSDPNQAMREQFQRTEIVKRTAEIDAQKQTVEAAKKAISDLEDQARQKGVPGAWTQP